MTYQIVMPIYKELPHIERNLESLNDWEHLLIVDNSVDKWCKKFEGRGCKIEYRPENIGVARSWNIGLKEGKEYTFVVSSSVYFPNGFIEVADKLRKLIAEGVPNVEYGVFTNLGWHCNAITQKTVEICGYFDENFYPAYEEDVDYARRLYVANLHGKEAEHNVPFINIDAAPIEIAATIKRAGLHVEFNKLRNYYIAKWGGDHAKETFDTPFNSGDLKYFPTKTVEQLKEEYGL